MRSRFWLAFTFLVIFALGFYIFRRETSPRQEIYYRRGLDFAHTGNYTSALLEMDKVLSYDPNYAPAHNNIGVIYSKLGRKKDALTALERAVAIDPAFPEARYNLGKLYMDLSMKPRALNHLKEAHWLEPDHEKASKAIAEIYYSDALEKYNEEEYNQAANNITKAYDYDPDRADILELWGKTEVKLGQYDGAIKLFRRASEKDDSLSLEKDISYALGRKGELLYGKGELESAARYLSSAADSDPENGRVNYYLGLFYSRTGDVDKAITHLHKGLKLDDQIYPATDQAEYHASIATGMKRARNYGKALQEYRLALAIDPATEVTKQLGECYFGLGKDVSSRGRQEEASSYLERAIELDPDNVEYRLTLAEELGVLGKHNKAVAEYRILLKLDPDSFENRVQLAKALVKAGLYDEAISRIEKIKKVRPNLTLDDDLVEAHFGRGNIAERAGEIKKAIEDYAYVVEVAPANTKVWLRLGECHEKMGDLQKAMNIYRRFIGDPEIGWRCHSRLGGCLRKSGDRDSAIAYAHRHIEKGIRLRDAGKFEAALREYNSAAEIVPDYVWPYHALAHTHFMSMEYKKSLPYMEKCQDLAPDSPRILNDLAVVYAKVGRYDDAEALFHQAVKLKSPYYRACANLSYLYGLMKKDKESMWWARQAGQIKKRFSQEGESGFWLR